MISPFLTPSTALTAMGIIFRQESLSGYPVGMSDVPATMLLDTHGGIG